MDRADAAVKTDPSTIFLKDYTPPTHLIDTIELTVRLNDDVTTVSSRLVGRRNPASGSGPADLYLDGEDQELVSLTLDGRTLEKGDWRQKPEGIVVPGIAGDFTLEVEGRIKPQDNTRLEGLYKAGGMYCTQCEAEGFRRITYFPDRPDVMAVYTVRIEADKARYPVLLSNGNRIETGDLEEGRHYAVWHDPFRKPAYLFAMVAGDLMVDRDSFTTRSGREVALEIYVEPGNEGRTGHAMDSLKRSMAWDEEVYGFEYDLDIFMIVAVSSFNMGAMENKGLNIFNDKFILANLDTATDADFQRIEAIVAHEYFHNWTGNRITCRDWFQLSLKEGLTVFRDQLFSADARSAPVQRIRDVRRLRAEQFPEDAGPTAHPVRPDSYVEINNFYTPTVYEKGAEVIGLYRTLLGPEGFRKGLDLYFRRHDGEAVTTDDFLAAMADANGHDLEQFRLWYSQAGTPRVEAEGRYDAAAKRYRLTLRQSVPATPGQPEKRPMQIPLAVGLLDAEGRDLPLGSDGATTRVLELTEAEQSFDFEDVPAEPLPSLNRGFSAPVILKLKLDRRQRAFLMAHDSDPFNRWEAGQRYACDLLLEMADALRRGETPAEDPQFLAALRDLLTDENADRAFRALAGLLPGETVLAGEIEEADPAAIHAARELLRRRIAASLRDELLALYRGNRSNAPFSPDAEAAGRRALKNLALAYLSLLEDQEAQALAVAQYRDADNMTDRMAALAALNERAGPEREAALADFHDRFRDDPVAIDKWLAVQAAAPLPDTLERVTALLGHPVFSLKVPNRVRALIGSFAAGNPARFHAADGSGYRFLADRVLELEPINPQVAARLVLPLTRWRRVEPGRQEKMQAELRRIAAVEGLSRDLTEMVSKALA
ncbi:aminopeptidase N [Thalassobaculum salexigens]|uniref:aminopeptidase N n=1 Tax=Thalassobaculum salexigens TaxID=455360 RepID=UPI00248E3825|nr:aminopeptidase N [Thalassobaculum salexigens]